MANGDNKTTSKSVTIEEIMFTIISATQEVFKEYMGVQLLAGLVVKQIQAINMDLIAIVGISGPRVGYIMIGSDMRSASRITMKLLSEDSVDEPSIRDAFGELANNIAGAFRTKYYEQYGGVAMGLPLVAVKSYVLHVAFAISEAFRAIEAYRSCPGSRLPLCA